MLLVGTWGLLLAPMALGYTVHEYMDEQTVNYISLNKEGRHSCYVKSPTAQDAFWPIPGLISCAGVTG